MKQILFILAIMLLLSSFKESERIIEEIHFETEYKFSSEIEEKVAKDTVAWKHQISASDYAIKGDYRNALVQWDLAMGTREQNFSKAQIDSINLQYSKVKATDYIIREAEKTQIVIINEAHHNSFHRVFTRSLLQKLFDVGYRHLGLEALGNGKHLDSTLNSRKYPILESGYYTKDPQFGNMIRTALEIGYNVFAYEDINKKRGPAREIEQARNIQQVIQKNPGEKFLIYCGFDHVLEGNHRSWEKAMAARLADYTQINPLTINQAVYSEKSKPEFNYPLLKALDIKESSVIIDEHDKPLMYKSGEAWADLVVFHPNTDYKENRPHWLFEDENNQIFIPLDDIQVEFPVLVLAFKEGEDINSAIPVDITETKNETDNCILALQQGFYTIVVTNGIKSVKFSYKVK